MLDLLILLVMVFLIIGVFMAVRAARESRDRLRVITRILMLWSANEHPEIFTGLQPKPFAARMEDGQKRSIEMNGELFECMAKGIIDAGEALAITGVSGRVFVIEKT